MSRESTMAKLVLHRLVDTSLPDLRVGLDAADEAAVGLGEQMTPMRWAAEREAAARGLGVWPALDRTRRPISLAGCALVIEETELPEGHIAR